MIVVHYNSRGIIHFLLDDLKRQVGIKILLHIVDCGDDGSLAAAEGSTANIVLPGENLGYTGGNNLILHELVDQDLPIAVINPDVRLHDSDTLFRLALALADDGELAAVAPSILTPSGQIEYTGSQIDQRRGLAIHTGTHVDAWPNGGDAFRVDMPWIDGACLLIRAQALREVGLLDPGFFLFSEEVDWCMRATEKGWKVAVIPNIAISHQRSSSFGTSTKGAYYAFRNSYYLFRKHFGLGRWTLHWLARLTVFAGQSDNRKSGASVAALKGATAAVLGRTGRMPGDQ